jgi:hypothetical protein
VGEIMSRHATDYERVLFEIIKEHSTGFFYESIFKTLELELFKVKAVKAKEEMVGRAEISFKDSDSIHYEIRYNRVKNLNEGYVVSF